MAGYLGHERLTMPISPPGVTVFSGLSLAGGASVATLSTTSLAISGGPIASIQTVSGPSALTAGQIGLVFAASGVSLLLSSGKTYYIIGQSATSAAHA